MSTSDRIDEALKHLEKALDCPLFVALPVFRTSNLLRDLHRYKAGLDAYKRQMDKDGLRKTHN